MERDRSVAPPLREIDTINLPAIERMQLSNGIQVYSINAGSQEVIKIELIFNAGRWQEKKRAIAATASKMLLEGTTSKSAQQIAEEIDFYGATISTDATIDYGLVTLYSLNKHLDHLFPLLHEVIYEPTFPERELSTYVQNSKQRLLVSLQKVDFLAHKGFNECLYGKGHPVGYTTSAEDYDAIDTGMLKAYHQSQYKGDSFRVIVAGRITDHTYELLDRFFGMEDLGTRQNGVPLAFPILPSVENKVFIEKKDAIQSGIRIGKLLVNKLHPDYPYLRVLNTILGGYFGSRLMQNLREDKGYCYGIHSSIASYLNNAHLSLATEVGKEVTKDAVREIYLEMDRLRSERVSEEELQLVKNYMLGVFLGDVDGPFNVADVLRGLIVYGIDEKFFYGLVEATKNVTSADIQRLAIEYLDPESMLEVVAGDPSLSLSNEPIILSPIESQLQ